jgi:hypothetical protein
MGCGGEPGAHPVQALGAIHRGFWHLVTGVWLMYLAFAAAVNFSLGWTWSV